MNTKGRMDEILEVKKRSAHRHGFISFEMKALIHQWAKTNKSDACVPDFYLIRTVTYLEVFTRRQIARLIDHAKQYTDRALELTKHFKMDFAIVREVQWRTITLGDIVAHNVPVNSFGQIVSYFETLLDKPLRPLLIGAVDRWRTEIEKQPSEPIIPDFDALASRLSRLFVVRHILCHEMPSHPAYTADEVSQFLDDALRFAKALEEVVTFERFGRVPLTETEMNIAAGERLASKEEELSRLLCKIQAGVRKADTDRPLGTADGAWLQCLDDAQQKWLSYRNAHCDFVTFLSQGGTIRPLLWGDEATRITELRIAELQSWLDEESMRLVVFTPDSENSE